MSHPSSGPTRLLPGARPPKLGTFGGVLTPSLLAIFGVILFRRLGYVVGHAGLLQALLMLGLATAIFFYTSVSWSAIATNRKVKEGGDYYLISRGLGSEYGGALGVLLFLTHAASVAFYCMGFAEGVTALLGGNELVVRVVAAGAVLGLCGLAYNGSDVATRFRYVAMTVLVGALISFFAGAYDAWNPQLLRGNLMPAPSSDMSFWGLFAILFPAFVGFTQGVSMSGDLEDTSRSSPRGVLLAVGLSTVVYAAAIVMFAASRSLGELGGDYEAMGRVARAPWLVVVGVLLATGSSALLSFLGGPRILQALANDRLFKGLGPFAVVDVRTGIPRRAVVFTALIAFVSTVVWDLNAIARLVSMCLLVFYGLLNYATYVEATGANPVFRPRFRFHVPRASLTGACLCGAIMLAINPMAAALAVAVLAAVHQYLRWTAVPVRWRGSRRAYRHRRIKDGLQELATEKEGRIDWQPQILLFTGMSERRSRVLQLASWISGGTGLVTAVQLVKGDGGSATGQAERREVEERLRRELAADGSDAFPLVVSAPDPSEAASTLLQAWGAGPIRANTVAFDWVERDDDSFAVPWRYTRLLQRVIALEQNIVVFHADEADWVRLQGTDEDARCIDVWWCENESSRLGLLFAYLMTRTDEWGDSSIRLLIPTAAETVHTELDNLQDRLAGLRIKVEVVPVIGADAAAVIEQSSDAALVLIPLRIDGEQLCDPFGGPVERLVQALPVVTLVAAAQDIPPTGEIEEKAGMSSALSAPQVVEGLEKRAGPAVTTSREHGPER